MSRIDDLDAVIRLACLTEDRTNEEQKALLRLARHADTEANENSIHNRRMWGKNAGTIHAVRQLPESLLEKMVDATRVVSEFAGDGQRRVALPAKRKRADPVATAP